MPINCIVEALPRRAWNAQNRTVDPGQVVPNLREGEGSAMAVERDLLWEEQDAVIQKTWGVVGLRHTHPAERQQQFFPTVTHGDGASMARGSLPVLPTVDGF